MFSSSIASISQRVTVKATNVPAEVVFRDIMDQTGKNFVYSSNILEGLNVTVDVKDAGLKQALNLIFKDTGIEYKVKGKSILLKKKNISSKKSKKIKSVLTDMKPKSNLSDTVPIVMLKEILVESRLNNHPMSTSEIGAMKLSAEDVAKTPVLFGEGDVMKSFQMQPGIIQSAEGMAGMSVHGGDADQNLVMIDNIPLYSSDHCMGIFSAFNVDAIGHIDFYRTSMPAKYDGRLSSYLDVRTKNGNGERHNGSVKLGLTSGAFSINGPIGRNTTYSLALRRTLSELLTLPLTGLINLVSEDKVRIGYSFIDFNGKVSHYFNKGTTGFVSVYYGDDWFYGSENFKNMYFLEIDRDDKYNLRWGNIAVQSGLRHDISEKMKGEFSLAYTRFFSTRNQKEHSIISSDPTSDSRLTDKTSNNIGDFIIKGDFEWRPNDEHRIGFGGGYTLHSFIPERTTRKYLQNYELVSLMDSTWKYIANEGNLYIEDDWTINRKMRMNAGLHASIFSIQGKVHTGISPRLSLSYNISDDVALKGSYSHAVQYVHRLSQSYLSLPTDQWVPITGGFKPETSDKVSIGGYWMIKGGAFLASVEGYLKSMNNIVEYRDEYYLKLPMQMWSSMLCSGEGKARGIDIKIEKRAGAFTGHIAYSLGWADRKFAAKNGGKTYPARLDHRHTLTIHGNWNIDSKIQLSAVWTGHSGSRFTLMTQVWEGIWEEEGWLPSEQSPLQTELNRYRLPFYHRLDLSCTIKNKRGFWNFSLYNAYCHLNTVGIRMAYNKSGEPVFQKIALLPIIPSASYTWIF